MTKKLLQSIFDAAASHGEQSEPDMEVGDLQQALACAWQELSPGARKRVYNKVMDEGGLSEWGTGG